MTNLLPEQCFPRVGFFRALQDRKPLFEEVLDEPHDMVAMFQRYLQMTDAALDPAQVEIMQKFVLQAWACVQ